MQGAGGPAIQNLVELSAGLAIGVATPNVAVELNAVNPETSVVQQAQVKITLPVFGTRVVATDTLVRTESNGGSPWTGADFIAELPDVMSLIIKAPKCAALHQFAALMEHMEHLLTRARHGVGGILATIVKREK